MIALTRSLDLFMKTTKQEIENINKIVELRFATQNEIKEEINYFENKIKTKIKEINQRMQNTINVVKESMNHKELPKYNDVNNSLKSIKIK